ncbi:MAG: DMT family transporter [Hyphomicrobium sp.]|nr:DMT family transporter [Hyphomicrobium sp.]
MLAGASVVATRFVIGETDPITLAFCRFSIASSCFLPFVIVAYRGKAVSARDLAAIAALGIIFFGLFPWTFSASLNNTTAARGAVGLSTMPIATLLLSVIFGRESLSLRSAISVFLAFVGVSVAFGDALLSDSGSRDYLFGDALMLVTALIGAIYTVFAGPYLRRYGPLFVTGLAVILGALALATLNLMIGNLKEFPQFSTNGWAAVLFLGTGGGAIQFMLYTWPLRWISPTRVALFLTLAPISAMLLASVILGEQLTVWLVVGLTLVLAAIFVANARHFVRRPALQQE